MIKNKKGKVGKVKITRFVSGAVFGNLGSSILEGKTHESCVFWRASHNAMFSIQNASSKHEKYANWRIAD